MIYSGGCHCKNVRFTVDMQLKQALTCNCSICTMKGTVLDFVPTSKFKLISGKTFLNDYQFNKKAIHHYFCKNCGVSPFGEGKLPDGTKMNSINLRCLDDVDFAKLPTKHFNGKAV